MFFFLKFLYHIAKFNKKIPRRNIVFMKWGMWSFSFRRWAFKRTTEEVKAYGRPQVRSLNLLELVARGPHSKFL